MPRIIQAAAAVRNLRALSACPLLGLSSANFVLAATPAHGERSACACGQQPCSCGTRAFSSGGVAAFVGGERGTCGCGKQSCTCGARSVSSSIAAAARADSKACGCGRQACMCGARGFSSGGDPTWTPPPDASRGATADLCDVHVPEPVDQTVQRKVQIMQPIFRDLGGRLRFSGQASTVKCFENNPLVRKALEEPGQGRVLVVDGGASMRCALLGDNLAANAVKNGWSGIIVNGCIRDSEDIGQMDLGVKALATYPLKSSKRDPGLRDVPVQFAGVTVKPGDWIYADKDGVLVSPEQLKL